MGGEKFEVSYVEPNKEQELTEWVCKIVKSAKVVHYGSEGKLTIQFTDGAKYTGLMSLPSGKKEEINDLGKSISYNL